MRDLFPTLYLFARLPNGVRRHLAGSNDLGPARAGRSLVAAPRQHVTMLDLNGLDVDPDFLIAAMNWIMSTIPPFAFHVVFDQLILSPPRALLKASQTLVGAVECQDHLTAMLADYGIVLDRGATPVPHVTLGYGYRYGHGTQAIDGISWQVEELALVRSLHGEGVHQCLASWQLPAKRDQAA